VAKKLTDRAQKNADAARICLHVCKDFGIDTKNVNVLNAFKARENRLRFESIAVFCSSPRQPYEAEGDNQDQHGRKKDVCPGSPLAPRRLLGKLAMV
jgi:hypothetical protein